jgi:hypothetical protein
MMSTMMRMTTRVPMPMYTRGTVATRTSRRRRRERESPRARTRGFAMCPQSAVLLVRALLRFLRLGLSASLLGLSVLACDLALGVSLCLRRRTWPHIRGCPRVEMLPSDHGRKDPGGMGGAHSSAHSGRCRQRAARRPHDADLDVEC